MEEVINYPGEVYVETIELVTSTGRSVDLSSLFRDISLFEDMFSTSMSGYVLIEDALNLIEELPIVGEEYLNISLRTPTLKREIKKSFDNINIFLNRTATFDPFGRVQTEEESNQDSIDLKQFLNNKQIQLTEYESNDSLAGYLAYKILTHK